MLAQVFWAPKKGRSHALSALFLFSKPGQKRQADPCSSPLDHILRNIKWGGIPWGQYNKLWGPPSKTHTLLSYTKHTDHLSVSFLFPFLPVNLWKGKTHLTRLTRMALAAPALHTVSQQTCSLYHLHTSSAPPRAGVVFDLLTGLQVIIVHWGWREYFKQDASILIYIR